MNSPSFEPHPIAPHQPRFVWASLFLIFVTILAYSPIVENGFINYDDAGYVTADPHIKQGLTLENIQWAFSPNGIVVANWHPLTTLSHMLDVSMFGMEASSHHAENVAWHCVDAVLLFALVVRLTGRIWRSLVVAALFALHPVHVQSVAWASSRKDVLSLFFAMLTYHAYLNFVARPNAWRYVLTAFLLLLGLMSKPTLVTLPATLLLLDIWPLGRWNWEIPASERWTMAGRLIFEKIGFFAVALVMSFVVFRVQQGAKAMADPVLLTGSERACNALISYCRYLISLTCPIDLSIFYKHPTDWPPLYTVGSVLLLAAITGHVIWHEKRQPYLFVGWFWFLGAMIPMIGLVQVGSQSMADRYAYFPFIGLYLAAVWFAGDFLTEFGGPNRRAVSAALAGCILCIFSFRTYVEVQYWRDTYTLFSRAIQVDEHNAMAHLFVANDLSRRAMKMDPKERDQMLLDAAQEYQLSIRDDPTATEAYVNFGATRFNQGQYEEAGKLYMSVLQHEKEEQVKNRNPGTPIHPSPMARLGLGMVLAHGGPKDQQEAIAFYADAVGILEQDRERGENIDPKAAHAYRLLALAKADQGRFNDAERLIAEAIQINPDDSDIHNSQGVIYAKQGKFPQAAGAFGRALELDPNSEDARVNLQRVQKILEAQPHGPMAPNPPAQ